MNVVVIVVVVVIERRIGIKIYRRGFTFPDMQIELFALFSTKVLMFLICHRFIVNAKSKKSRTIFIV